MGKRLSEDEILSVVSDTVKNATSFYTSQLEQNRLTALKYYNGEPYGNERDGHSKVVTTEVRDAVEWIKPQLLRIFAGTDEAVRFEPRGPEDAALAEQVTDYVNFIFNTENNGFVILHNWITDGLVSKLGVVKSWWEETAAWDLPVLREAVSDAEFLQIASDDDNYEILEHTEEQQHDEAGDYAGSMHDVRFRRRRVKRKVRIENVPPEEFFATPDARFDLETGGVRATACGHKRKLTASELVQMGYDQSVIDELPAAEVDVPLEALHRNLNTADFPTNALSVDPSQRQIWVYEVYLNLDVDGDGIAELRKITLAGTDANYSILDNEPWDRIPFSVWTPVVVPHALYGMSIFDLVGDLQLLNSTLVRQILDNLYKTNNPRTVVTPGVNIEDVLNNPTHGVIRAERLDSVSHLTVPFAAGAAMPLVQYVEALTEARTGVGRNSMGLNPDALQYQTATAANMQENAAQQKVELIARVFAETGFRHLFRHILHLVTRHQDYEKMVRLKNGAVSMMDPRTWDPDMDVTVNVGLGTGNKQLQLVHLQNIAAKQEMILSTLGPQNPLCSLKQYHNTLAQMIVNAGLKVPDRYFTDPGEQPAMPEQQQPQQNPELVKAQAQIQVMQMKAEAEIALKREKQAAEMRLRELELQAELELKRAQLMGAPSVGTNIRSPV